MRAARQYSPAFIFITGNHKGLPCVPRAKISRNTYHSRLILPIRGNRDTSVNQSLESISNARFTVFIEHYPTLKPEFTKLAIRYAPGRTKFFSLSPYARATIHALYSHLRSIFLDATACCTRCGTVSRIFIRPPAPTFLFALHSVLFSFFHFFFLLFSLSLPPLPPSSPVPPRSLGVTFFSPRSFSHRHPPHLLQLSSSNNAFFFHETFFVSRLHVLHPRLCTRIKTQPSARGGGREEGGRGEVGRSRKKEHRL